MYYFYDDMILGSSLLNVTYQQNIDYLEYAPSSNSSHYLNDNLNLLSFRKYINANPDYKINNSYLYHRLSNISWRRINKNTNNLPEISPLSINWDKNSDITWLFGPKIHHIIPNEMLNTHQQQSLQETQQQLLKHDHDIDSKFKSYKFFTNDNSSLESFNSDCSFDEDFVPTSERKNSSVSSSSSSQELQDQKKTIHTPDDKSAEQTLEEKIGALDEIEDEDEDNYHIKSILKIEYDNNNNNNTNNNKSIMHKKVSFNYIINTREIINGISFDYDFMDYE